MPSFDVNDPNKFVDSDFELIKKYQKLGFEVEIDDSVNEVYSIYMNLTDFDLLNVLNVCEECYKENLDLYVEIEDETFNLREDFNKIDLIVSKNPLLI